MSRENRTYVVDEENRDKLDKYSDELDVEKSFIVRRALKFYIKKVIEEKSIRDRKLEARRE